MEINQDREKLELEKSYRGLPSKYDNINHTQQPKPDTPVTDHLNNLDTQAKFENPSVLNTPIDLDNIQNASILNVDTNNVFSIYTPTETFQLAGLAICYYSIALMICVLLLILNNAQIDLTKNIKHKLKDVYGLSLDLSNKFIYICMLLLTFLLLFVGVFLIVIY